MEDNKPAARLAFLDVGRGLAALLVVAEHGLHHCSPAYAEWSWQHLLVGRIGVLVFLIISGFIIPQSLRQGGSNARFWLRRFFRLFPAYWACIAVLYFNARAHGFTVPVPAGDVRTWLLNLTMLQGFFGAEHVCGVFWTLQLELLIYATCSLLSLLRLLDRARLLIAAGAVAYLLAGTVLARRMGRPLMTEFEWLLYAAPVFGFVAHDLYASRGRRWASVVLLAAVVLVPWAVYLYNFRFLVRPHAQFYLWNYFTHVVPAYLLFLALIAAGLRWPMPAFARRLGVISYSIYLLHPLVLQLVALHLHLPAWLYMPVSLAAALVVAELSYRLVEAPGLALGRRVERRLFAPRTSPMPVEMRRAA